MNKAKQIQVSNKATQAQVTKGNDFIWQPVELNGRNISSLEKVEEIKSVDPKKINQRSHTCKVFSSEISIRSATNAVFHNKRWCHRYRGKLVKATAWNQGRTKASKKNKRKKEETEEICTVTQLY